LKITLVAFAVAVVSGLALAMVMAQSPWLEKSLYPYAIILQTMPIAAISPLIIIWLRNNTFLALVICAWIVALFPIISNTTVGLNSADAALQDVFRLYRASRWQTLRYLRLPSALPYFLAGLRISGGLALIGAVVAEFVAGSGTATGLAWRIVESGNRLEIATLFAALALLAFTGVMIFAALSLLEWTLLRRWHESALGEAT
jgi:NitT/TauT family transport system permease protein